MPPADECERIFHAALSAGDTRGVEAALVLLAVQNPHRAQALLDARPGGAAHRRVRDIGTLFVPGLRPQRGRADRGRVPIVRPRLGHRVTWPAHRTRHARHAGGTGWKA